MRGAGEEGFIAADTEGDDVKQAVCLLLCARLGVYAPEMCGIMTHMFYLNLACL